MADQFEAANGATGSVMDVKTGGVLGMVIFRIIFYLCTLQPLHNGAALAFTPSVCYYIPQRQISTGDQLWKVNREIRKSAGQKIGIAKQRCFRSPPGTRMNQAKSNAILFVSSAKMTRISL